MVPEGQGFRPPLASCDSSHHQRPKRVGGRGRASMVMATSVAPGVSCNNVLWRVLSTVLSCQQMLGSALDASRVSCLESKLGWRAEPHWQIAVIASARLGEEGEGTQGFEAFLAHRGSGIEKDSRASLWRTSGTRSLLAMRAQHRRFCDRRLLFSSLVPSVQALGLPVDIEQ